MLRCITVIKANADSDHPIQQRFLLKIMNPPLLNYSFNILQITNIHIKHIHSFIEGLTYGLLY